MVAQLDSAAVIQQLLQQNQELKQRLEKLESLVGVKASAAGAPPPMVPRNGFFIQGDVGYQQRLVAGESGYTNTQFFPGVSGSAGIGYRYNRNWRFSAEYANLTSTASVLAGPNDQFGTGYQILAAGQAGCGSANGCVARNNFVSPGQPSGTPGPQGDITLQQYTLNAYYDLPGFGYQQRYRPYLGIGVGSQRSTISGLGISGAPAAYIVNADAWAPLITFDAGLSYMITNNSEIYAGAKYALGSELWFQNTAFGNLLPQSSRNWILKTGIRLTF